jgi:hypothetical protein
MGKFNRGSSSPVAPVAQPMMPVAQHQMQPGMMQPGMAPMSDKVAKLKELKELLDAGVLTQEEFDAQKKVVLEATTAIMPVQPGMIQARPPPPGCPPGGSYQMVKYCGPQTKQSADCLAITGLLLLPAMGVGIWCFIFSACARADPKDEKELYVLGGTYYTLNGTIDTNVGAQGGGRKR